MRCSACKTRFSAAWAQPAPGGSSAPGPFLLLALILAALALLSWTLEIAYAPWIFLVLAAFVATQVPIAWHDCRTRGGLAAEAGGTCPKCGTDNPVRLWSL